jgi:hypothetical protein
MSPYSPLNVQSRGLPINPSVFNIDWIVFDEEVTKEILQNFVGLQNSPYMRTDEDPEHLN